MKHTLIRASRLLVLLLLICTVFSVSAQRQTQLSFMDAEMMRCAYGFNLPKIKLQVPFRANKKL
jgi:hypothetical protein